MIRKLLQQLRPQATYASPLSSDRQAEYIIVTAPAHIAELDIPSAQSVIVWQRDKKNAQIYASGKHTLKSRHLDPAQPLNLIYFREHAACHGQWTLNYQDHEQQNLALSGNYNIQIGHIARLAQACLNAAQFKDDRDFGQWLASSIAHILTTQRIPARDIHAENERFAAFLRDALTLALRPKGLILKDLSLDIKTQSAAHETAPESKADVAHIVIAKATRPKKYYYCVRNGEQLGPYSQQDLQIRINNGKLKKTDLIWRKGMASWQKADEISELEWSE